MAFGFWFRIPFHRFASFFSVKKLLFFFSIAFFISFARGIKYFFIRFVAGLCEGACDRGNPFMLTGLLRPTLGSSSQRQNSNVFARELATVAIY
jgi:hypothetical protein